MLGAELDGVELLGTPSEGPLDSLSEASPTAPNSGSAGHARHDGELASLLRAGGRVTTADLRDPPQSWKPETAPRGSSTRLRPCHTNGMLLYRRTPGVSPEGGGRAAPGWVCYMGTLWAAGNKARGADWGRRAFSWFRHQRSGAPVLRGREGIGRAPKKAAFCPLCLSTAGHTVGVPHVAMTHIWWLTR